MHRMLLTILIAGAALGVNPYAESASIARADVARFAPDYARQVRYALLQGETVEDRRSQWAAVSMALNSVSRVRKITVPAVIGADYRVVRYALVHYSGRDKKAYNEYLRAHEKLLDPEFVLPAQGGQKIKALAGDWAGDYPILQFACQSSAPLIRADYLVAKLIGDSATYYEFSGVPLKRADFLRKVGLDVATIERLIAQTEANIAKSKVTEKGRAVVAMSGPLGLNLGTLDTDVQTLEANPIRAALAGSKFVHVAEEWFFQMGSGLWGTALYSAAGERQAAVPAKIATDRYGSSGRGEVFPLVTCLRCHEREGIGGLQNIVDDQISVPYGPLDKRKNELLSEIHDAERMADAMTAAVLRNTKAIARATAGMVVEDVAARAMTPREATAALVSVYERYTGPVDLQSVARSFDCTEEVARTLLEKSVDPVVFTILPGGSVTRGDWELGFASVAIHATGAP